MNYFSHMVCITMCCVLCNIMPTVMHAEFIIASVQDHSLNMCSCMQDLVTCSVISPSLCNCHNHPSIPVTFKLLTVLYNSPFSVVQLLNNSEIRHLTLAKCNTSGSMLPSFDYFTVKRLEKLSILYPGKRIEIELSTDMPYQEEPMIAVIHTGILLGETSVKAYTVKTLVDSNGIIPFPNAFMSVEGLPEQSSVFVTFLY